MSDIDAYQKGKPMKEIHPSTRGVSYSEWLKKLPIRAYRVAGKPPAKEVAEARPEFGTRA